MSAGDILTNGSGRSPEARIPREWMECERVLALSDAAFRIWVALWSYADGATGQNAFPSVRTLGRVTGRGRRAVFRSIAELSSSDGWSGPLLTKEARRGKGGERRSNLLTLVNPLTVRPVLVDVSLDGTHTG